MGINIGVFGELKEKREEAAKAIAKKDSEADISYYSSVLGGKVVSVVEPTLYPEKLQPTAFAAYLSDYCLIVADAPSRAFAETVVVLDLLEKTTGGIVTQAGLKALLDKTSLKGYEEYQSIDAARDAIYALQRDEAKDALPIKAIIDSSFEVKGVGAVALGVIKQGTLKQYDELDAMPKGVKIGVKSIQVHDVDVKTAASGDRFGISMKNTKVEDVGRGTVLGHGGEATKEDNVTIRVSQFAGTPIEANESLHACVGLQFVGCHVTSEVAVGATKQADIVFEKEVAITPGEPYLICRLNAKGNRAVASFKA